MWVFHSLSRSLALHRDLVKTAKTGISALYEGVWHIQICSQTTCVWKNSSAEINLLFLMSFQKPVGLFSSVEHTMRWLAGCSRCCRFTFHKMRVICVIQWVSKSGVHGKVNNSNGVFKSFLTDSIYEFNKLWMPPHYKRRN